MIASVQSQKKEKPGQAATVQAYVFPIPRKRKTEMNVDTDITVVKTRPHARTKRTVEKYEPSQDPIQQLPFIAMRGENGLPEANFEMGEAPRCFWHVAPSGDYSADCETGRDYARAYLAYAKAQYPHPGHLFAIFCDMARSEPSGIANGFLSAIDAAARAGTPAAGC